MSPPQALRWNAARLAQCQMLYEAGVKTSEIGVQYGITASTVWVMAWERKWRRPNKSQMRERPSVAAVLAAAAAASVAAASASGVAVAVETEAPREIVTAHERNFNDHLRRTIAAYWRAQGRRVELRVEEQGGDLLGIRSNSVNGVPVKR